MPSSHDACFDCHWKNLRPASDDCAGCHKLAVAAFSPATSPKRISAKFAHEGGKGEHVMECTTCHINITRANSLRGLTPDVPIAACASCHKDSKKTTYPKAVTIEEEFAQNKKTGEGTYCHTPDVGKKKPPPHRQLFASQFPRTQGVHQLPPDTVHHTDAADVLNLSPNCQWQRSAAQSLP